MRVLLDSNVYDLFAEDAEAIRLLADACAAGLVRVVVTPVVLEELQASPFGGLPEWAPFEPEPEAVAVLGHAKVGWARLGDGRVFRAHQGKSAKARDAIIAASAHALADALVSDDKRCRARFQKLSGSRAWTFDQFRAWLASPPAA